MKTLLIGLTILSSLPTFASQVQFQEVREGFRAATVMGTEELKGISGKEIMCITLHEDGTSDILEKAININIYSNDQNREQTILKNQGADSRWIFDFEQRSEGVLGITPSYGKYQPEPIYKSFRVSDSDSDSTILVEWSHRPYSVHIGLPGIPYVRHGYSSLSSISKPSLISRTYSYCKH